MFQKDVRKMLREESFTMNVATTTLKEAREWASKQFQNVGENLFETLSDFDQNYKLLRDKMSKSEDVPRIEMPVIEPEQIDNFEQKLEDGFIDIFKPFAFGQRQLPEFSKEASMVEPGEWLELGTQDGDENDDRIPAAIGPVEASKLNPTQNQIWFEKLINNILEFGKPGPDSVILEQTIIISEDGFILDGHHRYGQAILSDPSLRFQALEVPLDIDLLLDIARSFGDALGNPRKQ